MGIDVKKSVQTTLNKYSWSNLSNFQSVCAGHQKILADSQQLKVWQSGYITPDKNIVGRGLAFETPHYRVVICEGNFYHNEQPDPYYSIAITDLKTNDFCYLNRIRESGQREQRGSATYLQRALYQIGSKYPIELVHQGELPHVILQKSKGLRYAS